MDVCDRGLMTMNTTRDTLIKLVDAAVFISGWERVDGPAGLDDDDDMSHCKMVASTKHRVENAAR